MTPQVSVVVKAYNHAAYVRETIQSILDQSFQDYEIVVTDDASTDGTADVVRQFSDPRIHLNVLETNRGISIAMNETIARAHGEFIAILNSDDFALPGRLEKQVAYLKQHPEVAAVFGLPRIVDETGQPTPGFFDFTLPFSLPNLSRQTLLRFFFFNCNLLCAPTAMIRRTVYDRVGAYDPRLTNLQDFDMWVRVCIEHEIHIMREEVTAFRILAGNRNMSSPRRDSVLRYHFEYSQILRRYRAMLPDFLREVFRDDFAALRIPTAGNHEVWLAELALTQPGPAHRLFALQTLFETAQTADNAAAFARLREVVGNVDVFGLEAAARLHALEETAAGRPPPR